MESKNKKKVNSIFFGRLPIIITKYKKIKIPCFSFFFFNKIIQTKTKQKNNKRENFFLKPHPPPHIPTLTHKMLGTLPTAFLPDENLLNKSPIVQVALTGMD